MYFDFTNEMISSWSRNRKKKELKWKNKILGIFNWTASFSSWSKEDSLTFDFLTFLLKFIW